MESSRNTQEKSGRIFTIHQSEGFGGEVFVEKACIWVPVSAWEYSVLQALPADSSAEKGYRQNWRGEAAKTVRSQAELAEPGIIGTRKVHELHRKKRPERLEPPI